MTDSARAQSVYQRVLGKTINELRPELRTYFAGGAKVGIGSGIFEVAGSRRRILRPVLSLMARRRILFPEFAREVPFDIVNRPTEDGGLDALRTFHLPGRDRPLEDTMRVVGGELHDFLGARRGFEIRLALTVRDGMLTMRSTRQWLHVGRARIRLPRLARVTVDESWVDGRQHVDVRLRSPLLGEWFQYSGSFSYRYEEQ
ncbi:MAG TPA: DUF4166 domain-containing protein [Galbitalea sp.]|jgi:hypothetical protein|nr:DUF4166 domain-containing protein [Galbitalea sp.]